MYVVCTTQIIRAINTYIYHKDKKKHYLLCKKCSNSFGWRPEWPCKAMGPLKKAPTPSSRHRIAKASKKEEIKEKERVGLGRLYMCGVRSSSYKDQ